MREVIRKALHGMGLEVRLLKNLRRMEQERRLQAFHDRWEIFRDRNIKTVLDIGAHHGDFAQMIRKILPQATILAFEPLADSFQQLSTTAKALGNMECFRAAVGDQAGEIAMHRSEYAPSSSLRPMQEHVQHFPFTAKTWEEKVPVASLDELLSGRELSGRILAKVDVQGAEDMVIRGGPLTMKRIDEFVVETSCYPLYTGQPLFDDIYRMMRDIGFVYRGNIDQIESTVERRIVQVDAHFERVS